MFIVLRMIVFTVSILFFSPNIWADMVVIGKKSEVFLFFLDKSDSKRNVIIRECPEKSLLQSPSDREKVCPKGKAKRQVTVPLGSFRTLMQSLFDHYHPYGISKLVLTDLYTYRKTRRLLSIREALLEQYAKAEVQKSKTLKSLREKINVLDKEIKRPKLWTSLKSMAVVQWEIMNEIRDNLDTVSYDTKKGWLTHLLLGWVTGAQTNKVSKITVRIKNKPKFKFGRMAFNDDIRESKRLLLPDLRIVYSRYRKKDGTGKLWMLDPDTHKQEQLAAFRAKPTEIRNPALLPDGRIIFKTVELEPGTYQHSILSLPNPYSVWK